MKLMRIAYACALLLLLAACMNASNQAAPPVVDGVVDLRGHDFRSKGPLALDGDSEVLPAGLAGSTAVRNAGPSGDFVTVPWSSAHRTTRNGRDLDLSDYAILRVRVLADPNTSGLLLETSAWIGESHHVRCIDDEHERSHEEAAGIASLDAPGTFT